MTFWEENLCFRCNQHCNWISCLFPKRIPINFDWALTWIQVFVWEQFKLRLREVQSTSADRMSASYSFKSSLQFAIYPLGGFKNHRLWRFPPEPEKNDEKSRVRWRTVKEIDVREESPQVRRDRLRFHYVVRQSSPLDGTTELTSLITSRDKERSKQRCEDVEREGNRIAEGLRRHGGHGTGRSIIYCMLSTKKGYAEGGRKHECQRGRKWLCLNPDKLALAIATIWKNETLSTKVDLTKKMTRDSSAKFQ